MARKRFEFTDFERTFLEVPLRELTELILVAFYLDVVSLKLYGCQRGAMWMSMDKSLAQIRAEWGWEDDLPPAEKRRLYKENPWATQEELPPEAEDGVDENDVGGVGEEGKNYA